LRPALLCVALGLFVAGFCCAQAQHAQPAAQTTFTDKTASDLLLQLSEALEGHSQKKMLALFDLPQMKGGGSFKQQINLFFSQTESIHVHLNLVETATGEKPSFTVDAEMDAQPSNGGQAWRRNERLSLTVANAGGSWKFVEIQPRSFFSLP
jgi:hypothetical protein